MKNAQTLGKPEGFRLPDASVRREMLKTGLPIFAELMLVSLFVMVDMALLKPCGTVAIAAVGLTVEPINILEFAFFALQTAVIAQISGCFAKKETSKMRRMFIAFLKLCTVASIIIAILVGVLAEPLLGIFGANEETLGIAAAYLRVSLVALVLRRVYGAITTVLKGIGVTQWSLWLNLIANAVNIVFDVLLIYGIGPFPELGPVGAAVATMLGCLVGFICSVPIAYRQLRRIGVTFALRDWLISSRDEIKSICVSAAPMVGEKVMIRVGVFIAIQKIASLGVAPFATHRILLSLQNFAYLGAEAISTTILIFASRAFAQRSRKEAQAYFSWAALCGMGFALCCSAIFFLCAEPLMRIYSADEAVIRSGAETLRMIAIFQPFQSMALIYAGTMRSCGLARIPAVVTTLGIVVVRPILVYALTPVLGVYGAWIAISCDEIFRMFALFAQRRRLWRTYEVLPSAVETG